jgi:nitric-oxide synthase
VEIEVFTPGLRAVPNPPAEKATAPEVPASDARAPRFQAPADGVVTGGPLLRGGRHRYPGSPNTEQLIVAARQAWASADKHMGRLRWRGLQVRDLRGVTDPDLVALGLAEHLRMATSNGRIRSVVTVLDPAVELLNDQLVGYAGYRQADGSMLGDPRHLDITERARRAGWPGGRIVDGGRLLPGEFDVLPLLVRVGGGPVIAYDLPPSRVQEVLLQHPRYPWFAALGLRWYAVPAQARYRLHLTGALAYPVAFSGFSAGFEMARRDLASPLRYDALPTIARCLGLDTTRPEPSWSEDARHVLDQAILYSFGRDGLLPPTASTRLEIHHRYLPAAEHGQWPAYRPVDDRRALTALPSAASAAAVPSPVAQIGQRAPV